MSVLDQIAQGPRVGGLQIAEAEATGAKAGSEATELAGKLPPPGRED